MQSWDRVRLLQHFAPQTSESCWRIPRRLEADRLLPRASACWRGETPQPFTERCGLGACGAALAARPPVLASRAQSPGIQVAPCQRRTGSAEDCSLRRPDVPQITSSAVGWCVAESATLVSARGGDQGTSDQICAPLRSSNARVCETRSMLRWSLTSIDHQTSCRRRGQAAFKEHSSAAKSSPHMGGARS